MAGDAVRMKAARGSSGRRQLHCLSSRALTNSAQLPAIGQRGMDIRSPFPTLAKTQPQTRLLHSVLSVRPAIYSMPSATQLELHIEAEFDDVAVGGRPHQSVVLITCTTLCRGRTVG